MLFRTNKFNPIVNIVIIVFGILLATVMIVAITLIVTTTKAHAEGSTPDSRIRSPNTFYAYVNSYADTGERLEFDFSQIHAFTGSYNSAVEIFATSPGGSRVRYCTFSGGIINTNNTNNFCRRLNNTSLGSNISGIWKIEFVRDGRTEQLNGDQDRTSFSWNINVIKSGNTIPGRVWSRAYALNNWSADRMNLNLWYVSQYGYKYKATYHDYMGVDSWFDASSHGLVDGVPSCNILSKSKVTAMFVNDPNAFGFNDYLNATNSCGIKYKVFFAEPANDLPATALLAGTNGNDWINPPKKTPALDNLLYTQTVPNSGKANGKLDFTATDFTGEVKIDITVTDLNTNISKTYSYAHNATEGSNSFIFNGDSSTPTSDKLKIEAIIFYEKHGEIHFVNIDAERRGGFTVEALNGSVPANKFVLFWDDSDLITGNRCSTTNPKSSLLPNPIKSNTPGGAHGWLNEGGSCSPNGNNGNSNKAEDTNNGSWGDNRYINDWTYDYGADIKNNVEAVFIAEQIPYLRAYGGDIVVGRNFPNPGSSCKTNDSLIGGYTSGVSPWAGAGGEFAVSATSKVEGFMSGNMHGDKTTLTISGLVGQATVAPSSLIFGNASTPWGRDQNGYTGCMPDFESFVTNNGGYPPSGNQTINLNALSPGDHIFVDGNITITGNSPSNNPTFSSLDDIKPIIVIAKGDINIQSNVTDMEGIFVALPKSDGTGGTINTCASINQVADCNNNLTVTGSFVAKEVKFNRLKGDIASAAVNESDSSGNIAEKFIFPPDYYLGLLNSNSSTTGSILNSEYRSIVGLPPIL